MTTFVERQTLGRLALILEAVDAGARYNFPAEEIVSTLMAARRTIWPEDEAREALTTAVELGRFVAAGSLNSDSPSIRACAATVAQRLTEKAA